VASAFAHDYLVAEVGSSGIGEARAILADAGRLLGLRAVVLLATPEDSSRIWLVLEAVGVDSGGIPLEDRMELGRPGESGRLAARVLTPELSVLLQGSLLALPPPGWPDVVPWGGVAGLRFLTSPGVLLEARLAVALSSVALHPLMWGEVAAGYLVPLTASLSVSLRLGVQLARGLVWVSDGSRIYADYRLLTGGRLTVGSELRIFKGFLSSLDLAFQATTAGAGTYLDPGISFFGDRLSPWWPEMLLTAGVRLVL
jgi:hypothetical protein